MVENHNAMAGYYYDILQAIMSPTKKGDKGDSVHFVYINVSYQVLEGQQIQ